MKTNLIRPIISLCLGMLCVVHSPGVSAAESPSAGAATRWGPITLLPNGTGLATLAVRSWPEDGKLTFPAPFANITAAYILKGTERVSLKWLLNADATQLQLEVPTIASVKLPAVIVLETAEKTAQFADGRITFSALDANVSGTKAKLESHPGNHRIGFWSEAADAVNWDFKPTRWGMYDLEVAYSAADGDGTELQIEIAGKTFTVARPSTGSWYRYATLPAGRFYLEKQQPFTVKVSCKTLKGGAVANLKAVTLRPAPEGKPNVQAGNEALVMPAGSAITHSVTMRYEPLPNKNCLGYWVNANDWAEWQFTINKPGAYEVEVWHGSSKGQGGDIQVEVNGEQWLFKTVDTGDIHKHTGLNVGRVQFAAPGNYSLAVKPQKKFGGAIMDIGQVKLLPVNP